MCVYNLGSLEPWNAGTLEHRNFRTLGTLECDAETALGTRCATMLALGNPPMGGPSPQNVGSFRIIWMYNHDLPWHLGPCPATPLLRRCYALRPGFLFAPGEGNLDRAARAASETTGQRKRRKRKRTSGAGGDGALGSPGPCHDDEKRPPIGSSFLAGDH